MKVIVAGAGIGGLTAAIALSRHGVEVEVVERAAELLPLGAGLTLQPNAMRALDALDLAGPVERAGARLGPTVLRTSSGRRLGGMDLSRLSKEVGPAVGIHRGQLQRLLLASLGESRIRYGVTVLGASTAADHALLDTSDGGRQADAVVGADGANSTIRAALHGAMTPRYAGYTCWRGVVPGRFCDGLSESWGRGRRFGLVPIGDNATYWFATRNAPEGEKDTAARTSLLEMFGDFHNPIPEVLARTPDSAILRHDIYNLAPLSVWGRGRVTLLGDAAHPMTPNLGQGACQAIEDAVVLARVLTEPVRGADSITDRLRDYEAQRRPRTRTITEAARRLGEIGQWESSFGVWVRGALMQLTPDWVMRRRVKKLYASDVRAQ